MAKEILVKIPRTTDGKELMVDDGGATIWKEMVLPLSARPHLERLNEKLPKYLQRKISVVGEDPVKEVKKGPGRPVTKTVEDDNV